MAGSIRVFIEMTCSSLRLGVTSLFALLILGLFCNHTLAGGNRVSGQKPSIILAQASTIDQRIEAALARAEAAEKRAKAAEKRVITAEARAAAAEERFEAVSKARNKKTKVAEEHERAAAKAAAEAAQKRETERKLDEALTRELLRGAGRR